MTELLFQTSMRSCSDPGLATARRAGCCAVRIRCGFPHVPSIPIVHLFGGRSGLRSAFSDFLCLKISLLDGSDVVQNFGQVLQNISMAASC
jgi:hypothetical protein